MVLGWLACTSNSWSSSNASSLVAFFTRWLGAFATPALGRGFVAKLFKPFHHVVLVKPEHAIP
jgi:hypothetical protein